MNRAIFLATIVTKFRSVKGILQLIGLAVGFPILMVCLLTWNERIDTELLFELILPMFTGPMLPMFLAYMLVQDGVANSNSFSGGEYLALLFTRPVSRFNYVITKWLAASIGVSIIVAIQITTVQLMLNLKGIDMEVAGPYDMVSLILNSFSYSALIVLIYSFPAKIGIWIFLTGFYAMMLGSTITKGMSDHPGSMKEFLFWVSKFINLGQEILLPSIDVYTLSNNLLFTWSPVLNYVFDTVAYLVLATMILNRREFFYATE